MTDEKTKDPKAEQPQEAAPAKKGGMTSYIVLGGIFVVVMAVAIGVTLFMFGGGGETASTADSSAVPAKTEKAEKPPTGAESHDPHATGESEDVSLADNPELLDEIKANLELLDYMPSETEIAEEEAAMSVEDSLKKVDWFKQEQARLDKRESEISGREKKLFALDKEVTKKITRIEQAESTRIANLARLYDDMDPQSVAKLMASLDDATVVSIIPRMKNKNASQVLALMPSQRAARLSKQMITIAGDK